MTQPFSRKCTGTTRAGQPCRAWAVAGSDPPRCASHADLALGAGMAPGDGDALKRGLYAVFDLDPGQALAPIDTIIHDLATKQAQLSALISQCLDAAADHRLSDLVKLLQLHGQNASRLARLLRDKRALSGEAADGIAGALAQALDELATEWGITL